MRPASKLLSAALFGMAFSPLHARAAPEQEQVRLIEQIGEVLNGTGEPKSVRRYFHADAVFVGQSESRWDVAAFVGTLRARGCGTRTKAWSAEQVVNMLPVERRDAARTAPSYGPGLSFYCASATRVAGHEVYTFRFDGAKIRKVYFALFAPVPVLPTRTGS